MPDTEELSTGTGPLRTFALPLFAVIGAVMLPFPIILAAYIASGQAHFLMAYLYLFRAGRMNIRYVVVAVLLVLLAVWYFMSGMSYLPLFLVAGTLFAAHFSYDEFTLHQEPMHRASWLLVTAFTLLFLLLVLAIVLPVFPWILYGAPLLIGSYAFMRFRMHRVPSKAERYIWFVAIALVALAVFGFAAQVLGVIILLHVANWYVGYAARLSKRPAQLRRYYLEAFVSLALMIVLVVVFMRTGESMLAVFFGVAPYYAWAFAHIVLSFMTTVSGRPRVSA